MPAPPDRSRAFAVEAHFMRRYGWSFAQVQETPAVLLSAMYEADLARDIAEGFDWDQCPRPMHVYPDCPTEMEPLNPHCQRCVRKREQRKAEA